MARIAAKQTIVAPFIVAGSIVGPTFTTSTVSTATLTADSLYIEFDTGLIPDSVTLVAALNALLTFLQTNGSIQDD